MAALKPLAAAAPHGQEPAAAAVPGAAQAARGEAVLVRSRTAWGPAAGSTGYAGLGTGSTTTEGAGGGGGSVTLNYLATGCFM